MEDERIEDLCVCVGENLGEKRERERIDPENTPNALFFLNSGRWESIYSEFVMFCLVHTNSFC